MRSRSAMFISFAAALLGVTSAALAQSVDSPFQIRYASNLNLGDSVVNITNDGANGSDPVGRICANIYVFDPTEEMVACCSCLVTPNGLNSVSVKSDLISNTLTPAVPTSVVVKLLSTLPVGGTCNPAGTSTATIATGLLAWGTTTHSVMQNHQSTLYVTETPFSPATLSAGELATLSNECHDIQILGSGFGICKSCRSGGR